MKKIPNVTTIFILFHMFHLDLWMCVQLVFFFLVNMLRPKVALYNLVFWVL